MDVKKSFMPFVDDEEIEDFLIWAFGSDWEFIENGGQLVQAWNDRHYHELQLELRGSIKKDANEMVEIWYNRD